MSKTLFEKYGGVTTVSALVVDFYGRVMAQPELATYFDGIDLDRLIEHQTTFISMVLGGPKTYRGRSMKAAHAGLAITEAHFGEVAELLQDTLEDNGVEAADVDTILSQVAALKDSIVTA